MVGSTQQWREWLGFFGCLGCAARSVGFCPHLPIMPAAITAEQSETLGCAVYSDLQMGLNEYRNKIMDLTILLRYSSIKQMLR